MHVHFGQIYIKPGVRFPFSHHFQERLSEEVTALVRPSGKFIQKYGIDFKVVFNISAKKGIQDNEVRGPTVFKKTKDIEYTVFLPYDVIMREPDTCKCALTYLLRGVRAAFALLDIDDVGLVKGHDALIENICSEPSMFLEK